MDQDQIAKCEDLIIKYRTKLLKKDRKTKIQIRNELYLTLYNDMIKWIQSILSKFGTFKGQHEIVSLSWDCFEFCLKHYKRASSIPLPQHFYKYTEYFLRTNIIKSKSKEITQGALVANAAENPFDAFLHKDELKRFRDSLPVEYRVVFEDAMMSLPQNRVLGINRFNSELGLTYPRYLEAKKVFKMIISFMIKGEKWNTKKG